VAQFLKLGIWCLGFGASGGGVATPLEELLKPEYNDLMNTQEMTEKLQDWQKRATETAKNLGQATDNYVRENTWTTVAFAAVLGCIFGYFLANRRD